MRRWPKRPTTCASRPMLSVPAVAPSPAGCEVRNWSTGKRLANQQPQGDEPDDNEPHAEICRRGLSGQRHATADGVINLCPSEQPHPGGQGGEHCEQHPEDVARPGDRQLRDELDYRNRRGQQTQGGALPSKEGALVGKCEPVVRLKLRCSAGALLCRVVVVSCQWKPRPHDRSILL